MTQLRAEKRLKHAQAIALLMIKIDELESKTKAYQVSVNVLCEDDGIPHIFLKEPEKP